MKWLPAIALAAWVLLLVCWTRGLIVVTTTKIYRKLDHLMAQVSIEQDDLDAVGTSLEELVDVVRTIDTSKLPAADKTKLQGGLTDLTSAINDKLSPTTPVEPPAEGDV